MLKGLGGSLRHTALLSSHKVISFPSMEGLRHRKKSSKNLSYGSKLVEPPQYGLNGETKALNLSNCLGTQRRSSKRLASAQSAPAAIEHPSLENASAYDIGPEASDTSKSKKAKVGKHISDPSLKVKSSNGKKGNKAMQNWVVDELAASIIADTKLEDKPPTKPRKRTSKKSVKESDPSKPKQPTKKERELIIGASQSLEIWTEAKMDEAIQHLKTVDSRLAKLIDTSGPAHTDRILPKGCKNVFSTLTRTIMGQQLATSAARVIYGRFLDLVGKDHDTPTIPKDVLELDEETLKSVGLSRQKASYVKSLAEFFESGELSDEKIAGMDDQTLITELTKVKGIGRWSVDMFAMFNLGHTDVLPIGDLGVRNGMKYLYNLKEAPSIDKMEEITECWRPYRSLGSYYMWHALDVEKQEQKAAKLATPKKTKKSVSKTSEIQSAVPL